jgi:hypothetical protein
VGESSALDDKAAELRRTFEELVAATVALCTEELRGVDSVDENTGNSA